MIASKPDTLTGARINVSEVQHRQDSTLPTVSTEAHLPGPNFPSIMPLNILHMYLRT